MQLMFNYSSFLNFLVLNIEIRKFQDLGLIVKFEKSKKMCRKKIFLNNFKS